MPINSYKLGPGTLVLGSGPLDVSSQVTACTVVPSENTTTVDAIPVLSGEELPAEDTFDYSYELQVTFLQDLAAAGVVDWSWTNKGTEQPVTFIPNTVTDRQVQGTIRVVPLAVGGSDMKQRPTSDATWKFVGVPDFEAAP